MTKSNSNSKLTPNDKSEIKKVCAKTETKSIAAAAR